MTSPIASLKSAVKAVVARRPGFAQSLTPRKPGCTVLMYHRVGAAADPFPNLDVASFRAQMEWLVRNCNVIAPGQLRERACSRSHGPRPDVLVTFDDGYRDYHEHAYPVLRRLGIPAINFLCTRFVDDPTLVGWWDRLYLAINATTKRRAAFPWAPSHVFDLTKSGKATFLRASKEYIKRQPELAKEETTQSILDVLDVEASAVRAPRQTMTWDEVREASDLTYWGGHTHNHVIVSRLDAPELETEIRTCRDRIAAETGRVPEMFAYPNGREIDFTDDAKGLLERYGFRTAFSTINGLNGVGTDWMEVRRISGGSSVTDLAWRISRLQR
jgi:peptidoglycan/xylan/chitin deacetylase (PgdA/CDA1 family)